MRLVLASQWRPTASILLAAAMAAAAFTAVASFPQPSPLQLAGTAALDGGIPFTQLAVPPTATVQRAVDQLLDWLLIIGWAAALVGAATILALWAVQSSARGVDLSIHRAVGASRRLLLGGALGEGFGVAALAVLIGIAAGSAAAAAGARAWPGQAHWSLRIATAVIVLAGAVLVGALFPLWSIRSRRVAERVPIPPPLSIPAAQLGASLAILVAGSMVASRGRAALTPGVERPAPAATVYRLEATLSPLAERSDRYRELLDHLRGVPNVSASLASPGAHQGLGTVDELITDCGQCLVGGIILKWRRLRATYHTASADTFEARGAHLTEGRGFSAADRIGAAPVAIVNRYLADRYFERGKAVGREVFLGGRMGGTPYRVVGIVEDGRPAALGGGLEPLETIYLSTLQHPGSAAELVVTGPAPDGSIANFTGIRVKDRLLGADLAQRTRQPLWWFGRAFLLEGAAVLALALLGTSTLMLLWVKSLESELAIRRSVGARRRDILGFVLRPAVRTGLFGVAIGLVFFGPAIWPELARVAPGLESLEPPLVARYAALLVTTATISALVPAVRAARASAIAIAAG